MTVQGSNENTPQGVSSQRGTLVMLALGLLVGLLVYGLREQTWPYAWRFGLTQSLLLGGLAFALAVGPGGWRLPAGFALVLTGTLALLAVTAIFRFGPDALGLSPSLNVESVLLALVALTIFQSWQDVWNRRAAEGVASPWRGLRYEQLFGHIWGTLLVVIISFCFLGLLWILLGLFASLFKSVGVDAFDDLLGEPFFQWPVCCAAFALCIHFTRAHDRIVAALRSIVFTLFSVLAPVFLALSASFLVVLILGGFERLANLVSASTTLLVLTGFGLVFVNAVIRDGTAAERQHVAMRASALLLIPCLCLLCGFAVHAIVLRVDQYGLTPDRIFVVVVTALLTLVSFAYLAALLARGRWMVFCRYANTAVALIVAAVAVVLQTPLADPYRMSAESQYQRLISGTADPETFDYGFLKFHLGLAGEAVLERLAQDTGAASAEVVEAQLGVLAKSENYWNWQRARSEKEQKLTAQQALADPQRVRRIPASLELPENISADAFYDYRMVLENCGPEQNIECLLAAIDVTDQPGDEFLFAYRRQGQAPYLLLVEQSEDDDGWHAISLVRTADGEGLWSALLAQDLEAVPPTNRDLRVGGETFRLYGEAIMPPRQPSAVLTDVRGPSAR